MEEKEGEKKRERERKRRGGGDGNEGGRKWECTFGLYSSKFTYKVKFHNHLEVTRTYKQKGINELSILLPSSPHPYRRMIMSCLSYTGSRFPRLEKGMSGAHNFLPLRLKKKKNRFDVASHEKRQTGRERATKRRNPSQNGNPGSARSFYHSSSRKPENLNQVTAPQQPQATPAAKPGFRAPQGCDTGTRPAVTDSGYRQGRRRAPVTLA